MDELEYLQTEEALQPFQKKDLYNMLYKKIENYYLNYGKQSFDLLNCQNSKNAIINNIFEKTKYNLDDEIYLKEQYFKLNKKFYNEYKNYIEDEPEQPKEPETKKLTINWIYLFQTLAFIAFLPIYIILCWIGGSGKKTRW